MVFRKPTAFSMWDMNTNNCCSYILSNAKKYWFQGQLRNIIIIHWRRLHFRSVGYRGHSLNLNEFVNLVKFLISQHSFLAFIWCIIKYLRLRWNVLIKTLVYLFLIVAYLYFTAFSWCCSSTLDIDLITPPTCYKANHLNTLKKVLHEMLFYYQDSCGNKKINGNITWIVVV